MTKKIEDIPLTDIVTEIRRIAAESPDHTYQQVNGGCLYVEPGGADGFVGSCIVGKALVNLGIAPEDLHYEDVSVIPGAYSLLKGLSGTTRQAWWIDSVQAQQDAGYTWAESVAEADGIHQLEVQS